MGGNRAALRLRAAACLSGGRECCGRAKTSTSLWRPEAERHQTSLPIIEAISVSLQGEKSSDAGPLAPQAVWWWGRDYTRLRGNGGAGRDNCPKGQAKAGRNMAKR